MASDLDGIDPAGASRRPAHRRIAITGAMLCLSVGTAAIGEEAAAPMFLFSGFGTLGLVYSGEESADFVSNPFVPNGAGFTRQLSPEVDSTLGVQLTGNFSPQFSATVQLVAEQRYDGEYVPHVEWGNIKYQLTPQLSVRLGRTALASFLVSDFRKVGYANPWVRPPNEVYGLVPIFNSDGVDASYKLQLGDFIHTLLGGYGQTDTRSSDGSRARVRDTWTISDTVERGPATLRISYQEGYMSIDALDGLFSAFRQFGPQGIALADRYDPNGRRVRFIAIGGMYDPGKWFAMAEWGKSSLDSVFGDRSAWYVSGGLRVRTLTPYVTFSRAIANSDTSDPGLSLSGLPPQLAGPAAGLNAALNGILGLIPVQQTVSAGARWDFMKNVAFKLQYDRINLGTGSAGVLSNLQPGFQPGGNVNLFSATIDFVW